MMKNPRPEEEKIMKNIRNLFSLKKEIKVIKDMVLRNIKNLFEYEKEKNYKPVRVNNFGTMIILNTKVTVIKIGYYRLKNILHHL